MAYKMGRDSTFVAVKTDKAKEETAVKKLDAKIAELEAAVVERDKTITAQVDKIAELEAAVAELQGKLPK